MERENMSAVEQWEYMHKYIAVFPPDLEAVSEGKVKPLSLVEALNEVGAHGWELVSISSGLVDDEHLDGYAIFKRKCRNVKE